MDPVLTVSPLSPSYLPAASSESLSKCSSPQTTPKLPRRERLASFSRLIASENFLERLPSKSAKGRRRGIDVKGRNFALEPLPTIHVSPSSPKKKHPPAKKLDPSFLQDVGKRCLDLPQLPFSPRLLADSPKQLSPGFKYPTPTKSPLYRLDRKNGFLGRGSFGNVTLCVYKDSKFALKVIRSNVSMIGERNFLEIRHPHLVAILHISQISNKELIFMEFAGHCNLQQVLDTKSELDFPRRLSFCIQILSGLRHCHQHDIVHGDVKPANVIVSPHGVCKLGDFGHSFNLDLMDRDSHIWPVDDIVGTAAYAAPEVLRGSRPKLASDMYSFGVLLWQVYIREPPFAGEHPHVIIYKVAHYGARPTFPKLEENSLMGSFSKVAEVCWDEDPTKRLDASEALHMLKEIAQQLKQMQVY